MTWWCIDLTLNVRNLNAAGFTVFVIKVFSEASQREGEQEVVKSVRNQWLNLTSATGAPHIGKLVCECERVCM